jgi:hypothetical protein
VFWFWLQKVLSIRSLVSPVYSTRSRRHLMSRLCCQACGPGRGPLLRVVPMRNLMGPVSISPRAFHGRNRKPSCFFRSRQVKQAWSELFQREILNSWKNHWVVCAFSEKNALTEYSPRASCCLKQKVRGSWKYCAEELKKNSPKDIYHVAPEPISGFFFTEELRQRVLL